MTIEEAQSMLRPMKIAAVPQDWCDLGCGSGIFSRALALLLPEGSHMLCMDRAEQNIEAPANHDVTIEFLRADFTKHDFQDEKFDGFMMANSLHYVNSKMDLLERLRNSINAPGKMIIIEYDTDSANQWVPYPIRFGDLTILLDAIGLSEVKKLSERPSVFGAQMYACEVHVP